MKNLLEVECADVTFGTRRVLNNIYIAVESNEIIGVVGCNGSGKSSLINMIFRQQMSKLPTARLNGSPIKSSGSISVIRYAPQSFFTPAHLKLKQLFDDYDIDSDLFVHYFNDFKCLLSARMKNLSIGERKIAELYAIIRSESLFCLLDEPFTYLMPMHYQKIKSLIRDEAIQGKGFLIADNNYKNIEEISDRLYLLENESLQVINGEKKPCFRR